MLKKFPHKGNQVVLIIVAHPDDETIGMGGTIAKHTECGDSVFCLRMTNGIGARPNSTPEEEMHREEAAEIAAEILGFKWLESQTYPDNAMDQISLIEITKEIERIKNSINPTLIYTHSAADLNIDHRLTSQAVLTAFRPQPYEIWTEIRAFETASATDYGHKSVTGIFSPNLYIDISSTWNKKEAALTSYEKEMRKDPHSRSIEGIMNLSKYRGNQGGITLAEAFEIIRKIER